MKQINKQNLQVLGWFILQKAETCRCLDYCFSLPSTGTKNLLIEKKESRMGPLFLNGILNNILKYLCILVYKREICLGFKIFLWGLNKKVYREIIISTSDMLEDINQITCYFKNSWSEVFPPDHSVAGLVVFWELSKVVTKWYYYLLEEGYLAFLGSPEDWVWQGWKWL